MKNWGWRMIQWVKCLLCENKDLRLHLPQTCQSESQLWPSAPVIPVLRDVWQEDPWSPLLSLRFSKRPGLWNRKWLRKKATPCLASACMWTYMHLHNILACPHLCMRTHIGMHIRQRNRDIVKILSRVTVLKISCTCKDFCMFKKATIKSQDWFADKCLSKS